MAKTYGVSWDKICGGWRCVVCKQEWLKLYATFQFSCTSNRNNLSDETFHTVQKDTVHLLLASKKTVPRPKPADFSGEKIHSMSSFGGELKPSVPCRSFAACKRTLWFTWKSESQAKLTGHFSPVIPCFTNRYLSCRLMRSASGDNGRN
jgi:hypothetical protein